MESNKNIFNFLNSKYPNKWSTKNAVTIDHEGESRQCLFIELEIDGRTVVGCSSTNKDFNKDVSEELLESAVRSAYNKMFTKANVVAPDKQTPNNNHVKEKVSTQYSKEQLDRIHKIKEKHHIQNKEQWTRFVKLWDKTKTIDNLNSENINEFLNYIEKIQKVV